MPPGRSGYQYRRNGRTVRNLTKGLYNRYTRRYGPSASRMSSYRTPRRRRTYTRRRTTRRRTYPRHRCSCESTLTPGQKFLIAQADPFEPRALGCKIPDSSTQPSTSIACQELSTFPTVGTPATDVSAVAYVPGVTSSIIPATSGVAAWTWPAAFAGNSWSKRSDLITSVECARPVAHGLRISSAVSPTTATGFVHLACAVETVNAGATTHQYATTIAQMSGYSWYKRVTLASLTQTPLTIINKYVDETAFRYLGIDTVASAAGATGNTFHIPLSWGALIIAVEGVPTSLPIQVEMMLHLECIPQKTGVLSGSNAASSSPSLLAGAASISSQTDFAHTEDQQDSYVATALSNAAAGAGDAGNAFMSNVIAPAAYGAGRSAANAAMGAAMTGIAGIMGVNANPARLALN